MTKHAILLTDEIVPPPASSASLRERLKSHSFQSNQGCAYHALIGSYLNTLNAKVSASSQLSCTSPQVRGRLIL